MSVRWVVLAAVSLSGVAVTSCAHFGGTRPFWSSSRSGYFHQLHDEGRIQLDGWLRVRGEAMIYFSQGAMNADTKYPFCVSGVFESHDPDRILPLDGKEVIVTAQVFEYTSLEDEDFVVKPRKVLGGSIVPNGCLGRFVLLLESMDPAM